MKFNLPIKFVINEKDKVVIAKFDNKCWINNDFDMNDYIIDHSSVRLTKEMKRIIRYTTPKDFSLVTLSGKAKCANEDNFDVKKGMKIAKTRLMIKFYKEFYRAIYHKEKELQTLFRQVHRYKVRIEVKEEDAMQKLERILREA